MAAGSRAANLSRRSLRLLDCKRTAGSGRSWKAGPRFWAGAWSIFHKAGFRPKTHRPRRDRDMRGALRDQPIGERRGFLLRAIQGHASAARMKEPRGKNRRGFGEQRVLQTQEHGRDLAGGARLLLRPRVYYPRTGRAPSRLIQCPLTRG